MEEMHSLSNTTVCSSQEMSSQNDGQADLQPEITLSLSETRRSWDVNSTPPRVDTPPPAIHRHESNQPPFDDLSIDDKLSIPVEIRTYWYEWMLYELEDCIEDFYQRNPTLYDLSLRAPRHLRGPLNVLNGLKATLECLCYYPSYASNRNRLSPDAIVGSYEQLLEQVENTLQFRHNAEHHSKMESAHLHAAVWLPKALKDNLRQPQFQRAYNVIVDRFPRDPSSDSDEQREMRDIISTRHQFPDPVINFLNIIVDETKRCSFNWAKGQNPSAFFPEAVYRDYESKYWQYHWPLHDAQDKSTKIAFADNDGDLLRETFRDVTEIRNVFIHRGSILECETIGSHQKLHDLVLGGVKLPLLLGDHDVAFYIDKKIRKFFSDPQLSDEQVEQEFQADEVPSIVQHLLDPTHRQSIIKEWFYSSGSNEAVPSIRARTLRERWVIIDLLLPAHLRQPTLQPPTPHKEETGDSQLDIEALAREARAQAHWEAGTYHLYLEEEKKPCTVDEGGSSSIEDKLQECTPVPDPGNTEPVNGADEDGYSQDHDEEDKNEDDVDEKEEDMESYLAAFDDAKEDGAPNSNEDTILDTDNGEEHGWGW